MDPWTFIAIVFILITIFLFKTDYERHFLFFVIRTKRGLKFIDFLARLKPELWMLAGDLGLVMSFGGLGALYLLEKEKTRRNLYWSLVLIATAGVSLAKASLAVKLVSILLLALAVWLMRRVRNTAASFVLASLLISCSAGAAVLNLPFYLALLYGFFGFPALIIALLLQNAYEILQGSMLPGISPLLPTTREGRIGMGVPGYDIFIPWWYALIAIVATFAPHELAHGILTRVGKVRLKSVGLLTFGGLVVGAFVEPDEEELKKKQGISKMRVYSAGSIANFAVGILCVLVTLTLVTGLSYFVVPGEGVKISELPAGYPAEKVLEREMVIYEINGNLLSDTESFKNATNGVKPGNIVTLKTDKGIFQVNTTEHPTEKGKGYMGVVVIKEIKARFECTSWILTSGFLEFLLTSLGWIYFFSISIGLVNLLPVPPFDGYRMFDEIVKASWIREKSVKRVLFSIIAITVFIFLLNVFPLLKMVFATVLKVFGL
ncbi:MAG: site-2 protease family protein [Candidatus Altiarchaeales archaeon]|nr:site-2 protease family protein [Candidatus Altiarchaeales archaeon]